MDNKILILALLGLLFFYFFIKKENFTESCDKDVCNTKMKEFIIDNNWSFNNSSIKFKECMGCDSKWFRSSELKTSNDGKIWTKHNNLKDSYNHIML